MKMNEEKQTMDWKAVYTKLEAIQTAINTGSYLTPETKQKVLHERARKLALEPQKKDTEQYMEILEFLLAYEKYAIESSYVREVYPLTDLTPLPCTPAFVLGIINVRGQILSVIDLKKFFDLPQKGLTDLNKVIILQNDKMEFGILADVILGINKISLDKIHPPLPTLTGIQANYLAGVTVEKLVILDAAKILSDERLIVKEGDVL